MAGPGAGHRDEGAPPARFAPERLRRRPRACRGARWRPRARSPAPPSSRPPAGRPSAPRPCAGDPRSTTACTSTPGAAGRGTPRPRRLACPRNTRTAPALVSITRTTERGRSSFAKRDELPRLAVLEDAHLLGAEVGDERAPGVGHDEGHGPGLGGGREGRRRGEERQDEASHPILPCEAHCTVVTRVTPACAVALVFRYSGTRSPGGSHEAPTLSPSSPFSRWVSSLARSRPRPSAPPRPRRRPPRPRLRRPRRGRPAAPPRPLSRRPARPRPRRDRSRSSRCRPPRHRSPRRPRSRLPRRPPSPRRHPARGSSPPGPPCRSSCARP